jgi:hypothetical protein
MNKPIDIITKTYRELGLRVLMKQAEYSSHAFFASTRIFLLPKGPNVLPILLHTITDKRQSRFLGYLYKDKNRRYLYYAWNPMSRQNPSCDTVRTFFLSTSRKKAHYALSSAPLDFLAYREVLIEDKSIVRDAHEVFFLASAFQDHASTPDLSYNDNAEGGIDYCSPERSSQGLSYVDEDEEDTESEFEQIVYSATRDSSIDCDIEDGDNYWNNEGSLEDETANMQASHHEWLLNGG